jgi:hypothetical protein
VKAGLLGYVIDAYDRQARLYPALLCLLPAVAVAVGVYGAAFSINKGLMTIAASFGGIFCIISIARDAGKRLEPKLFAQWGGKPTTQMLRLRDNTLNAITKQTYHEFLGRHLGVKFPSIEEEEQDPLAADEKYEAGIRWLLEKTRDKAKFPFVFKENVNYGFRRNCLGLRPLGLFGSALGLLWTLAVIYIASPHDTALWQQFVGSDTGVKVTLLVCCFLFLMWSFNMSADSVRRNGFAYADMLLRACDNLPKKR